jgi:hypothetical protein
MDKAAQHLKTSRLGCVSSRRNFSFAAVADSNFTKMSTTLATYTFFRRETLALRGLQAVLANRGLQDFDLLLSQVHPLPSAGAPPPSTVNGLKAWQRGLACMNLTQQPDASWHGGSSCVRAVAVRRRMAAWVHSN